LFNPSMITIVGLGGFVVVLILNAPFLLDKVKR